MGYPAFQHSERDTYDHESSGWVRPRGEESPEDVTDRLVLHGLSIGKHSTGTLALHVGHPQSNARRLIRESLRRLEKRGLVRCDGARWVRA